MGSLTGRGVSGLVVGELKDRAPVIPSFLLTTASRRTVWPFGVLRVFLVTAAKKRKMRINDRLAFSSRRCLKGWKHLNKFPSIGVHERKQANMDKKATRNLNTIKTKRNEKKKKMINIQYVKELERMIKLRTSNVWTKER